MIVSIVLATYNRSSENPIWISYKTIDKEVC
mgnify:CR=1 FL=1